MLFSGYGRPFFIHLGFAARLLSNLGVIYCEADAESSIASSIRYSLKNSFFEKAVIESPPKARQSGFFGL